MTRRGVFKIFVLLMLLILGVVALILFFKNIDIYNKLLDSEKQVGSIIGVGVNVDKSLMLCQILFFGSVGVLSVLFAFVFVYVFILKCKDEEFDYRIRSINNRLETLENRSRGLDKVKCQYCGSELFSNFKENCPSCSRTIREKVENK